MQKKKKGRLTEAPSYELGTRYDARKSFYGKAKVDTGADDRGNVLYSYGTKVAEMKDGKPVVYGVFSQTTLRHIKEWLKQNGFKADSQKQILNDYSPRFEESLNRKKSRRSVQEGYYRGCREVEFVSNGSYSDPDLIYKGKTFNYWDIEDALWNDFLEETGHTDSESNDPKVEKEFDRYVQETCADYLDDVIAGGYFNRGSGKESNSWKESLNRKKSRRSVQESLYAKEELDFIDLQDRCWSGATYFLKKVEENGNEDALMDYLEEMFADEVPTMIQVNDTLWFYDDDEYLKELAGENKEDEEYFDESLTEDNERPIATFTLTNHGGVEIYNVDDREETVTFSYYGGKKKTVELKIAFEDEDGNEFEDGGRYYFTVGKIRIYLDECMRTNF